MKIDVLIDFGESSRLQIARRKTSEYITAIHMALEELEKKRFGDESLLRPL